MNTTHETTKKEQLTENQKWLLHGAKYWFILGLIIGLIVGFDYGFVSAL